MAGFNGRKYRVYVRAGGTPPADRRDIASYTIVGDTKNLDIGRTRNAIDTSTKDDANNATNDGGRRTQTVSFTANYDKAEDTGQQIVIDAYKDDTNQPAGYFLISPNVAGEKCYYGDIGTVTQANQSFPDDNVATLDCAWQVTGAITEADVAT